MLTKKQLDVIKQTVPVLQENGELLTRHFYQRLFRENPEVKAYFNPAHQQEGTQQRALAAAICAYAQHIENPAALAQAVELITQKHASLGIQAEHYPIVGANLLASIQEVLGVSADDDIIEAWGAAYGFLADLFIQREQQIYDEQKAVHGWNGFRRFVVKQRENASQNIVSLYLQAEDGQPLPAHLPGQYVTVRLTPDGGEPVMRNYSLSSAPGAVHYRISVKREEAAEAGAPAGVCSAHIHERIAEGDVLEVAPPCGEFILKPAGESQKTLVLIAGGVGITPLLSMTHDALKTQPERKVVLIQCALSGSVRPFAGELAELKTHYPKLSLHVRFSEPSPDDVQKRNHDSEGVVDDALLDQLAGEGDSEFYLCGPVPMLRHLWRLLKGRGVDESNIHYEFFGPADSLQQAMT